jgi:large subunit ribosomal protein L19
MSELVRSLEHEHHLDRPDTVPIDELRSGDTVRVHFRIVEGKRERVQPFQGVIIRVRPGVSDANITVRRIGAHGIGVERTFPLHSPRLERIEIMRKAHVRRANLYYLRERTGKRARLREKRRTYREDYKDASEAERDKAVEAEVEGRGG